MKKSFKKIGLFLALGLTTAIFNSCNKDDDNKGGDDGNGGSSSVSKITATNVIDGSTQIKTVKALVYWGENYDNVEVIAQAPYQNNGFTLELPATLSAKYLEALDEGEMKGFSISDKNVKGSSFDGFSGYDKDGNEIGVFLYEERNENAGPLAGHLAGWVYVDGDVTIKGEQKDSDSDSEYTYEWSSKVDYKLKKGWNIVYASYTYTYDETTKTIKISAIATTQKPANVNFNWYFNNWYFEDDGYNYSASLKSAKSLSEKKSFFAKLKRR